jgi:hypothetical protein
MSFGEGNNQKEKEGEDFVMSDSKKNKEWYEWLERHMD